MIILNKRKWSFQTVLVNLLLLILFSLLLSCSGPEFKNSDPSIYSAKSLENLKNHRISFRNSNLHYVSIGTQNGIPLLMIHGTPGSWETFKYVLGNLHLQSIFNMASVDRLGWGESLNRSKNTISFGDKKSSSYQEQAKAIAAMIQHFAPNKPVILLGHSLGASIAPRVALDFPELVSGMILIAGTLDPELGAPRWYNHAANLWPINKLVGDMMMQSNKEIMSLKRELTDMQAVWRVIDIPITVIQGTSDRLVSPKNTLFAKQKLSHLDHKFRLVELAKVGHFIPWEQTNIIRDELILLEKKVKNLNTAEINID